MQKYPLPPIQKRIFGEGTPPTINEQVSSARAYILTAALELLGSNSTKYQGIDSGQTATTGFDCSGFVLAALRSARMFVPNLDIPDGIRHANEMYKYLGTIVHPELAKEGDLMFFSRGGVAVYHVAFYLGGNRYLHAPGKQNTMVKIATFEHTPIPRGSETGLQIFTQNPVGFKRLEILDNRNERWPRKQII